MCAGAIVLYKIPRVIVGENHTFMGAEAYMRSQGIQIEVIDDVECIALMRAFIESQPKLWQEDMGI